MGEVVRVIRLPVWPCEDVPGLPPRAAGAGVQPGLPGAVSAEDLDGAAVQGDGAATRRRLGRALDHVIADGGALAYYRQLTLVEIDFLPAQPGDLSPAQSAQGDQPPQREQRVVGHKVQELGQLGGGPHRHRRALTVFLPRPTRASVQTTAWGRRGTGSSTRRAGLSTTMPSRIAAL